MGITIKKRFSYFWRIWPWSLTSQPPACTVAADIEELFVFIWSTLNDWTILKDGPTEGQTDLHASRPKKTETARRQSPTPGNRGGSIYRKYRWYIADIDISVSVSYRHFKYRFFRYINIVSVTSEMSLIFRYFIILFPTFNVNVKTDNYISKTECLIWQYDTTSLHLVTSLLIRNGSYGITLTSSSTLLAIMKCISIAKERCS